MEQVRRLAGAATAPGAQRAYLTTLLFVTTSGFLLLIAAVAYPIFYYNYVPEKVLSIPVHLQYNVAAHPFGVIPLTRDLMSETAYDVSVELTLPRSPANTERGNFMIGLFALRSELPNPAFSWHTVQDPYARVQAADEDVVFASRRPALVPYRDPLVARAHRLLLLPWHLLFPDDTERVRLTVPMGELVEFRGRLPVNLLLDLQAGQGLQVYNARVELVARLAGVRWAMYNYRVLSFVVFTTLFWFAEMMSMAMAWLVLAYWFAGRQGPKEIPPPYDSFTSGTDAPPFLSTTSGAEGSGKPASSNQEEEYRGVKKEEEEEEEAEERRVRMENIPTKTVTYKDEGGEGTGSSYRRERMVQRRPRDAEEEDD